MEFKFAPVEPFTWVREYEDGTSRLIGNYVPGNTYNCTKEPRHDALRDQCKVWEADGKIVVLPLSAGQSFITVKPEA